jgi:hypothetical protein
MKRLIFSFFAVCLLVVSLPLANPLVSPLSKHQNYYYTLDHVDVERKSTVKAALRHLENSVSCLHFEELPDKKINDSRILRIITVKRLTGSVVGLYSKSFKTTHGTVDAPVIFLPTLGARRSIPNHFMFKIALHEIAHGLGMGHSILDKGDRHAFDEDEKETHFGPRLAPGSQNELYPKDIDYLERLLCAE